MSDYIAALRQDLVDAAEREQRRGAAHRAARPLHPRAWSPVAVLGAATALAAIVAVVLGVRTLGPAPRPADEQIVTVAQIGGQPRDAVAIGGSLVIADYDDGLYVVSPDDPKARRQLEGVATPVSLAADGDAVWAVVPERVPEGGAEPPAPRLRLLKVDPRTGRRLADVRLDRLGDAIRAGATGVWLPSWFDASPALVRSQHAEVGDFGVAERTAWTRAGDSVYEVDARGRTVRHVTGVADTFPLGTAHTIAPDETGAWVVGQSNGTLYRIDGDRVTRRVTLGTSAGVLARAGSSIWVSATEEPGEYQLVRVDATSGRITGRVRLDGLAPQVIAPDGDRLWVVTSGGTAVLVNPHG